MLKIALAISALVLSAAAGAAPSPAKPAGDQVVMLTGRPGAGATKGQLRVEWVEPRGSTAEYIRGGELRIYRTGAAAPWQVLQVSVSRPATELSLEFVDLNGDGYQDLVFDDAMTGTAGAAEGADVFLWVPKLQRFVKSETLSKAGELSPGRRPNCVKVMNKCSSLAWSEEELCFNQATGRWRTVADSGCRGVEP